MEWILIEFMWHQLGGHGQYAGEHLPFEGTCADWKNLPKVQHWEIQNPAPGAEWSLCNIAGWGTALPKKIWSCGQKSWTQVSDMPLWQWSHRELGFFILENRRLMEGVGMELSSSAGRKEPDEKRNLKLQQKKFGWDDRKKMFTVKVVKHYNRGPGRSWNLHLSWFAAAEPRTPSLVTFGTGLDASPQ